MKILNNSALHTAAKICLKDAAQCSSNMLLSCRVNKECIKTYFNHSEQFEWFDFNLKKS